MIFDGQLADTLAGQREDGIGHRWCNADGAGLADAARSFGVLYQIHLDVRRFVNAQEPVVVEVMLLDAAVLERDLAP